jgi:hypothetical protein
VKERSAHCRGCCVHDTQQIQETNICTLGGIRTHNLSNQTTSDLCLRPHSHWDQVVNYCGLELDLLVTTGHYQVVTLLWWSTVQILWQPSYDMDVDSLFYNSLKISCILLICSNICGYIVHSITYMCSVLSVLSLHSG